MNNEITRRGIYFSNHIRKDGPCTIYPRGIEIYQLPKNVLIRIRASGFVECVSMKFYPSTKLREH